MTRLLVALVALICIAFPGRAADILVANLGNGEITKVNPDTGEKAVFATGFAQPFGLALHPTTGDVYVSCHGDSTVWKVSSSGQKTLFASGLDKPVGIAFSPSGDLYGASYGNGNRDRGSVFKISPAGVKATLASRLTAPVDVAIESSGSLVVTSYGVSGGASVYRVTQAGQVSTFVPYTLSLPHGIASQGSNTFIAENGKGRILVKAGDSPHAVFAQSPLLSSVMGIVPANGTWYAASANAGMLVKISPTLTGLPVVSEMARGFNYPSAVVFRP